MLTWIEFLRLTALHSKELILKTPKAGFNSKDVSFSYPSRPDVTVLDHVNISVPPFKHTAIVGLSGSGKSTIAALAARLHDSSSGQVLFDGQNVRNLNTRDLRSHLSLVQQDPSLLDRSVLENIAHGLINSSNPAHAPLIPTLIGPELAELAKKLDDGQDLMTAAKQVGGDLCEIARLVHKAASLADADTFLSRLPCGYGTSVGSSGRLISGGQKQRIALARAIVKDPAVLILDEATASLDSKSEQRIQKALAEVTKHRTVLTIAHRLSTIKSADKIIVLHKGRVVEEGSHSELMLKDGSYAGMVRLQNSGSSTFAGDLGSETTPASDSHSILRKETAAVISSDSEKTACLSVTTKRIM